MGKIAPDFEQDTTTGGRIRFHAWLRNSGGVLFSRPKDYTPVCTTELAEVARLKPEWDKRHVKAISLSVDPASRTTLKQSAPMRRMLASGTAAWMLPQGRTAHQGDRRLPWNLADFSPFLGLGPAEARY